MLVCGFEIEGVLGRITLPWLGPTEDVSKQSTDIVVELRVEIFSGCMSDQVYQKMDWDILQLALFVIKHLVEILLVLVYFVVHLVNPAVIFVLEVASHQHHLLALEASHVFFFFGRAMHVVFIAICSALGRSAVW